MYPVPDLLPVDLVRELRFGPLFLEFVRMMVSSGLAGAHVQPYPRNNIELRATSCELRANRNLGLLEARGLWLEAHD